MPAKKKKPANRNVTTFIPLTTHQITTLKVFKPAVWNKVSGFEAKKGSGFYPDGPAPTLCHSCFGTPRIWGESLLPESEKKVWSSHSLTVL